MARLLPKAIPEEQWKLLHGNRAYAFLANPEDNILLRLGRGKSIYLEIVAAPMDARIISLVDYDTGESDLLQKISNLSRIVIGRTNGCNIKIMHAYVSRLHMEITLDGNILIVKDYGSINGSYYHSENVCFDIEKYLESHPIKRNEDSTLDSIHEMFGPNLDDFFSRYLIAKDKTS